MYTVEIYTSRNFDYQYFPGFTQEAPRKYVCRGLTKNMAKTVAWKARFRLYGSTYYPTEWGRTDNYKEKWLRTHPEEYFRCVYCGRIMPRRSVTVDHVVPVSVTKRSPLTRWILQQKGYENVDDEKNLVPACYKCNYEKGTQHSRHWSMRAFLGKSETYWRLKKGLKFIAVITLIGIIVYVISEALK